MARPSFASSFTASAAVRSCNVTRRYSAGAFGLALAGIVLTGSAYAQAAEKPSTDAPENGASTDSGSPSPGSLPAAGGTAPMEPADIAARDSARSPAPPAKDDIRADIPVLALTHSAFGTGSGRIGAHGFGYGQRASGAGEGGGGFTLYGSPLDRMTLLATAERHADGRFAPAAGLAYRIAGSTADAWALAAMGTYKAEGFAEVEGEIELGILFSIAHRGWHFDANGVIGGGLEESEELDGEGKLRAGYDVLDWLRVGVDGRLRHRFRGDLLLASGRTWDAVAGPQVLARFSQFYGSVLAGATTVDVPTGAGAVGWVVFGGVLP